MTARMLAVGLVLLVLAGAAFGFGLAVLVVERPTPMLLSEVRPALRYAGWCGGLVQVEPLFGGGHDVMVVGCDR